MFLIFISLITGYIGMALESSSNMGWILGIVGFLSPSLFLLQKIYIKLEELKEK